MTGQDILNKFHTYTGDQSELSTAEELDLLNNVYQDILSERPWEFLKKVATGTLAVQSDGSATATLPSDFRYFIENNQYTDISRQQYNNAVGKVVFTGPNYTPNQIINYSDRRQFRTQSGYCYVDIVQNKLVFPVAPSDLTYEFDYIYRWSDIGLNDSPIFPSEFHYMIYQLMAVDSVIINLFDRSHSYAKENQEGAAVNLKALRYWNSMLIAN